MTLGAAGVGTREHRAAERLAGDSRVVNDNDHNNRDFRQFEITGRPARTFPSPDAFYFHANICKSFLPTEIEMEKSRVIYFLSKNNI